MTPSGSNQLPHSASPTLTILSPSESQKSATWSLNSASWKGALSLEAYIRREKYLGNQAATRDGGIRYWILCDKIEPLEEGQERTVLASCETIPRKALVAYEVNGFTKVEDTLSYGVAAVFCNPAFRGRGFAGRLMKELGRLLSGQQPVAGIEKCLFTVLYSDVGKFYATFGWHPFPSAHMSILSTRASETRTCRVADFSLTVDLNCDSLPALCELDVKILRDSLKLRKGTSKVCVAMLPNIQTLQWHHAREEFMANELFGQNPGVKGAIVGREEGHRAWIIWTRDWTESKGIPVGRFYVLRLIVEGGDEKDGAEQKIAALLFAAVKEAADWNINSIQIWNPSKGTIKGARSAFHESEIELVERETENVACLRWFGEQYEPKLEGTSFQDVSWVGNERYGWL